MNSRAHIYTYIAIYLKKAQNSCSHIQAYTNALMHSHITMTHCITNCRHLNNYICTYRETFKERPCTVTDAGTLKPTLVHAHTHALMHSHKHMRSYN